MKEAINSIWELIGGIGSWICPKPLMKGLLAARNHVYTGYLRRRFARMGRSSFIWRAQHLEGERYIYIGDGNVFGADLQMTVWKGSNESPRLSIGNNCLFRHGCHITAVDSITIGDNLLTGTNVLITDNSHGDSRYETLQLPPKKRDITSKGAVRIGNNVWLGNNVCVMPGVTIGDGVVVGANSVVTHDIPPYAIAAGVPARIIKKKGQKE